MTSFTHCMQDILYRRGVPIAPYWRAHDALEGCESERAAPSIFVESQQRQRGNDRAVPGVRNFPRHRVLLVEATSAKRADRRREREEPASATQPHQDVIRNGTTGG